MTWVNDSTRVTIFGDSDSTGVMLKKMVTWLESRFSHNNSTRVTVNDSSHFYKISECLMDKPSSFAHKEMRNFCFSDDQDWGNFLSWLSSCGMLHFKDQVSLTCVEADLRLCFHWGVSRGTIYWHLIVVQCSICLSWSWQWVSYCDLVSFPDTNKVI